MKTKKDTEHYIRRAMEDFKTLVIYFNVTRPQYEANYKVDGKFSLDELKKQLKFLDGWNKLSLNDKHARKGMYVKYSSTFNYTFGIPNELVRNVLDCFRDEQGKKHRIPVEPIVKRLVEIGFIKVLNDGKKFKRNEDGSYSVKCYWTKKYMLKNEKYWYELISNPLYKNIDTFPNASDRVKKIIMKWHKKQVPQKEVLDEKVDYMEREREKNTPKWNALPPSHQRAILDYMDEFIKGRMEIYPLQELLVELKIDNHLAAYLERRAYQKKREWEKKISEMSNNKEVK